MGKSWVHATSIITLRGHICEFRRTCPHTGQAVCALPDPLLLILLEYIINFIDSLKQRHCLSRRLVLVFSHIILYASFFIIHKFIMANELWQFLMLRWQRILIVVDISHCLGIVFATALSRHGRIFRQALIGFLNAFLIQN